MHLTSIKLAGFKSFVDPTTVTLDPAVSVIVGPNGCGKSNILDAVRWAIGESAAQRLRGDINRDFIFSGSDTRPAASRASVELVFDNQDGRIGGDYASYSELAVRREVHSGEQSKSDYFLNGQRCRRNDVRDVFLGTGFGTRGYSIIQQDWITQLVNSDPETLREHLEEASGVSRYRARRHETFNKLNLTNQNLAQVRLKQDELAREIRQLKTQATRARRHVEVTQSLNRLKAQLLNRKLQFKQREQQTVLSKLGSVEDAIAKLDLRNSEFSNEQDRLESLLSAQQDEQADVAESRIEARTLVNSVVHRIEQLESARSAATVNIQLKCDQLSDSLHTLESDGSELMALESDLDTIQATLNDLKNDKQSADRNLGLARRNLDAANARMETLSERESALAMQIAELEAKLQIDQAAIENLADLLDAVETPDVEIDDLDDELKDANAKIAVGKQAESELLEHLSKVAQSLESDTQKRRDIVVTVEERGRELQKLRDEHLSLRTLQEASLGQEAMTVELEQWLATAKLEPGSPIGAMLQVESGWESAVEVVLGAKIRAIATSQFKNHRNHLKSLSESDVALFDIETEPNRLTESDVRPSLSSKFQGPYAMQLAPLVKGIYTCDSYSEATYLVERLGEDESIVTADGAWFGKDWVRLFRSEDRASGVIERARRSNELASKISDMEKEISDLHGQQDRIDREIDDAVTAREISQRKLNDVSAQLVENRTLVTQFTKLRDEKLKAQVAQQQSSDDRRADINRLRKAVEATVGKLDAQKKEQALIQREIEESQSTARRVESIFEERQESFDTVIERILSAEQDQTQCLIKVDSSERSQARQEVVVNRLVADLSSLISQGEEAKSELPGLTTKRDGGQEALTRIEQELSTKSRILRETQQELATVRKSRVGLTNEKDELTDTLSEHKSQQTRLSIEIEQLDSDLSELNTSPDDADGESELEVEEIELKIAESTARLERLGLINYRATTDLEDRVVEKEQLDEQVLDLETTMGEIQKAIERIDTETKRNLRDTFDAVNGNLARLFAALFGGGTASLEFTDEDILQAGVIVRARPPGKRNSTINMLSGGERAMTAIAFVFALFELNPSPVCILDEVDAPLDERNVVKFVELLAQMSGETQFVVITHNPATMELAGNLLGVTMEEPGVSRLVAVNLEDAYALAAQQ